MSTMRLILTGTEEMELIIEIYTPDQEVTDIKLALKSEKVNGKM